MRFAVFGDVHASLPALETLLSDIDAAGITRIWCLGDFAFGGSRAAECMDVIMERAEVVLAGNHEWFATRAVGR